VRILVTGSSGLVGEALCAAVRAGGNEPVRFDHRRPGAGTDSGEFSPQDVLRGDDLVRAVRDVEGVVHLAAVSRCAPAEADPSHARTVNVEGTANVLRALERAGNPAWFVLASSREVYGEPSTIPVSESAPVQPKSVYGRTKADAERVVVEDHRRSGRRATLLRFTNLYGSPDDHPERVIPSFLVRALRGEPLEVRGPDQLLDFLDVRDAARAIVLAGARTGAAGSSPDVLNIASGVGCTLGELARHAVSVTGSRSTVRDTRPEAWTPSQFVGEVSRARDSLGWRPSICLRDGLRALAEAYQARLASSGTASGTAN
jgi:UDP-glucose 4-epimerase